MGQTDDGRPLSKKSKGRTKMKKLSLLMALALGFGICAAAADEAPAKAERPRGERREGGGRGEGGMLAGIKFNKEENATREANAAKAKTDMEAFNTAREKLEAEFKPTFEKNFDAETELLKSAIDRMEKGGNDVAKAKEMLAKRLENRDMLVTAMMRRAGGAPGFQRPEGGRPGAQPQPKQEKKQEKK